MHGPNESSPPRCSQGISLVLLTPHTLLCCTYYFPSHQGYVGSWRVTFSVQTFLRPQVERTILPLPSLSYTYHRTHRTSFLVFSWPFHSLESERAPCKLAMISLAAAVPMLQHCVWHATLCRLGTLSLERAGRPCSRQCPSWLLQCSCWCHHWTPP